MTTGPPYATTVCFVHCVGVVAVWDVTTSTLVAEYEAHSKRIWSLDYCAAADPTLLASASDDCTVKLWSTKSPNSVAQVQGRQIAISWWLQYAGQ